MKSSMSASHTKPTYAHSSLLPMVIHELVRGHRLTPTQRRIAQWLARNAAQAAYLSSVEVADAANVSQPSVTRFATALGYTGYPDLRRRLQDVLFDITHAGSTEGAPANEWVAAVNDEAENLRQLAAIVQDPGPIERIGELLAASRPLPVIGMRAACGLGTYFAYFAAKFHPDVRLITTGGTQLQDTIRQARYAGAESALVFAMPRCSRETVQAVQHGRKAGLQVVCLADSPLSPAAEQANLVLHAPVGSELVFDSYAAPMVLTMVLLQAMCDARPVDSQQRLEAFENYARETRLFV